MTQEITGASIGVNFSGSISQGFDLQSPSSSFNIDASLDYTNGEGNDNINYVYTKKGELAASGTVTVDMYDSNTVGPFNNGMTLSTLKVIVVKNTSDARHAPTNAEIKLTTNGIGFMSGTTPGQHIKAGGFYANGLPDTGWTITNGSADTITLTNLSSERAATYELALAGTIAESSSSSSSSTEAAASSSSSSSSSST